MIETEKTKEGFIYAFCEWWLVNKDGKIDKDGTYVFVNDTWVHPNYRNNGIIKGFIHKVAEKYPQAKYMYYRRGKYHRIKIYSRNQLKEDKNGRRTTS